ncbi:shikimate kinase I [mine drainage metagenome]|uniref:shikimate kinase n=1 Tax=mine drainage metagenome TaxID=410659 RepID=T0Z7M8_9ZZZZ
MLGWRFTDTDQAIEQTSGVDIATIFDLEGEVGFRKREHSQLVALSGQTEIVIATGGGAVLMPENHPLLTRDSLIVLTVVSRIRQLERARKLINRPLLHGGDPEKVLDETWKTRQSLYYALANTTIDTTLGSPKELAVRLHAHLIHRTAV